VPPASIRADKQKPRQSVVEEHRLETSGKKNIMAKQFAREPIAKQKLVIIYLCIWLGTGLLAGLLHFIARPDYISIRTCVIGSIANLFGPFARLIAAGWPNAGKMPHTSSAIVGLFLLAICIILILMSLNSRRRSIQILSVIIFIPAVACWIFLGFLELMTCAV
jgi:hypothetical protein